MIISEDKMREIRERIPAKLGERIKKVRKHRRLSQSDLAQLVGKDRQYIYKIEKGRVTSNIVTIYLLSSALEIPLSELFKEIDL